MNYRYKLLCFCSNFALGLTSPVLSLILLEHGCTMSTLGIAISIFSIIVITAELPTGIFADVYGRKLSFILSLVFSIVMMIVLFLSHQFFSIVICMILMGLATAFSSGSLDAMAIEDYAAVNGSATLSKGLSQFYFFQGAGLAIGALAGGIIPHSTGYQLHIVLKSIIVLITLLVGFSLPHDNPHPSAKPSLSLQLKTMKNALQHSLPLDIILLCMALIAISQTAVETYWQPMLQSVSNGGSLHTSGLLASGAYLAVTAGCALMEKASMISSRKRWRVYLVLGFVEAGLIFALSYSRSTASFLSVYILLYGTVGMNSIAEQTILNNELTDSIRASMLSVSSLAVRGGCFLSGLLSSLIVSNSSATMTWKITSILVMIGIIFFVFFLKHHISSEHID